MKLKRNDPGINQYITNAAGRPFFDILRAGGIPVLGVVRLGVFVHVECKCESTARRAVRLLQSAGFLFLKISRARSKAENPNAIKSACGMTTWVDTWTAHVKVAEQP